MQASKFSNYNKNFKKFARENRKKGTYGEIVVWNKLLKNKKLGYQFNRQFPIENYIVDFISRKLKLVIEIDGNSHLFKYEMDKARDKRLAELGFKVIRFQERDVKGGLDNIYRCLDSYIREFEKKEHIIK